MTDSFAVPELVLTRATAGGAAGRRWLRTLPDVVASLADRWHLCLGAPFTGGTASFVVAAVDAAGRDCVLKVAMPLGGDDLDDFRRAIVAHRLAAGRGCAEVLEHDETVPAVLLERLGPNLHQLGLPLPQVLASIAATLREFWRPVGDHGGQLRTGAEQAQWLAGAMETWWDELGRPCPRAVVDRALAYCDERARAFDPATAVLVHGDAHGWNTLRAASGACKFVDAEGLLSEPEHDLGVPMREYNQPLLGGNTARLVRERAARLAGWCDVDPEAVWQWGFVERVATGLLNLRDLDGAAGDGFLEVAARCL